ncbi:hypothetical protein D3C72_820050 [compost metagenome]
MRKPGRALGLVLGADIVPDRHRHHRRLAVLVDQHRQAVVQLEALPRNIDARDQFRHRRPAQRRGRRRGHSRRGGGRSGMSQNGRSDGHKGGERDGRGGKAHEFQSPTENAGPDLSRASPNGNATHCYVDDCSCSTAAFNASLAIMGRPALQVPAHPPTWLFRQVGRANPPDPPPTP